MAEEIIRRGVVALSIVWAMGLYSVIYVDEYIMFM